MVLFGALGLLERLVEEPVGGSIPPRCCGIGAHGRPRIETNTEFQLSLHSVDHLSSVCGGDWLATLMATDGLNVEVDPLHGFVLGSLMIVITDRSELQHRDIVGHSDLPDVERHCTNTGGCN